MTLAEHARYWIDKMNEEIRGDEKEIKEWIDLSVFLGQNDAYHARNEEIIEGRITKEEQEIAERREIIAFLTRRFLKPTAYEHTTQKVGPFGRNIFQAAEDYFREKRAVKRR